MLILVPFLLMMITALALVVLRVTQPEARYAWLAAASGGMLAFISVFVWLAQMPMDLMFAIWRPQNIFQTPIFFRADGVSWAPAIAIAALTMSVLMTAVTRPVFRTSLAWAGTLSLGGLGILAVTANNPLTLLLIWALIDLTELLTQIRSVQGEKNSERVVISFSTRAFGIMLLLWSSIESLAGGGILTFETMPDNTDIYLVIAAGLRLGALPLHLPYSADSSLRRGFGTALRLIGGISTLSVLERVAIRETPFTPVLIILITAAALYGGWMWLRAPDELNGRPYWMIGMASLSVLAALLGNPVGSVAWACALALVGGALFLSSVQISGLSHALLIGAWSLSSLPFSLTASAWLGSFSFITPFGVAAQALLAAGFIRHGLRTNNAESLDDQPGWAKAVYPAGIIVLLVTQILLGWIGWDGAFKIGTILPAISASILTVGLVWATRRFRIFNPVRAHWVTSAGINRLYQGLWSLYRGLARLGLGITQALEGEGGIMWTLLFLALFISIVAQGIQ
ncbi:MAG: hypothetical protein HXY38_04430 [Chloroflexi bacterium]|nr:hypothetical protein [Chloroflexota bacterium]